MASVYITMSQAMDGRTPVLPALVTKSEIINSSSVSQPTAIEASGLSDTEIVTITVSGGPVWVSIGKNPTAKQGEGWLVLDNHTMERGRLARGFKVAVVDA